MLSEEARIQPFVEFPAQFILAASKMLDFGTQISAESPS